MSIRELLGKRIVICDGAMGTMIQKSGVPIETHPEMLNFTHPDTDACCICIRRRCFTLFQTKT